MATKRAAEEVDLEDRVIEDAQEEEGEEEEEEEEEETDSDSDELLGEVVRSGADVDLRFRTYGPVDKNLRKKVMKNTSLVKKCMLDDEVVDAAPATRKKDSEIAKFLPPVSNLDLKNIVAPKQRILDKRYADTPVPIPLTHVPPHHTTPHHTTPHHTTPHHTTPHHTTPQDEESGPPSHPEQNQRGRRRRGGRGR